MIMKLNHCQQSGRHDMMSNRNTFIICSYGTYDYAHHIMYATENEYYEREEENEQLFISDSED